MESPFNGTEFCDQLDATVNIPPFEFIQVLVVLQDPLTLIDGYPVPPPPEKLMDPDLYPAEVGKNLTYNVVGMSIPSVTVKFTDDDQLAGMVVSVQT